MQAIINTISATGYGEIIFLLVVFGAAFALFFAGYNLLSPSIDISRRASATAEATIDSESVGVLLSGLEGREEARLREAIETFYASLQTDDKDAISRRLVRAGFFKKSAVYVFYVIKIVASAFAFLGTFAAVQVAVDGIAAPAAAAAGGVAGLLALILPNFVLDYLGKKQEERYRRAFPDFMDMLIVCADAGLSLEASVARVAGEMLAANREFGIHLNIMMLEIRAGKRLRDALTAFGERLTLDEARSLATVFKQSEELGSSLTETLRVFSDEMRRARIVRAEEKANALPVKMVLPLGMFIFPVMLAVVAFPVLLTLMKFMTRLAAPT